MTDSAPQALTPDDVRVRLARVAAALQQACSDWRYRKIGPDALVAATAEAALDLEEILRGSPGPPPVRTRYDTDNDIYDAFQRVWAALKRIEQSFSPPGRQLAALFTCQGRLIEEVEDIKQRLTAQDDRMNGIALDLAAARHP